MKLRLNKLQDACKMLAESGAELGSDFVASQKDYNSLKKYMEDLEGSYRRTQQTTLEEEHVKSLGRQPSQLIILDEDSPPPSPIVPRPVVEATTELQGTRVLEMDEKKLSEREFSGDSNSSEGEEDRPRPAKVARVTSLTKAIVPPSGGVPVSTRRMWTPEETRCLQEGLSKVGLQWEKIKVMYPEVLKFRSGKDLRYKWRNLRRSGVVRRNKY